MILHPSPDLKSQLNVPLSLAGKAFKHPRRRCNICGYTVSYSNFKRHLRNAHPAQYAGARQQNGADGGAGNDDDDANVVDNLSQAVNDEDGDDEDEDDVGAAAVAVAAPPPAAPADVGVAVGVAQDEDEDSDDEDEEDDEEGGKKKKKVL